MPRLLGRVVGFLLLVGIIVWLFSLFTSARSQSPVVAPAPSQPNVQGTIQAAVAATSRAQATRAPTATPQPVAPRVVATSTESPPTRTPIPPPTATAEPLNLVGRAATNLPGTPLERGQPITSIVHSSQRPREVFRVDLTTGQVVTFSLTCRACDIYLFAPGRPINTGNGSALFDVRAGDGFRDEEKVFPYTPLQGGTYAIVITTNFTAQVPYTLSVE